jgi:uncharacterized protein
VGARYTHLADKMKPCARVRQFHYAPHVFATGSSSSSAAEELPAPTRVCVMGASGLLGTALVASLHRAGVRVTAFSRKRGLDRPGFGHWDPSAGVIERERLEGTEAIVNLAGASLADGRWTDARKREVWSSRVESTALLARTLAELAKPPEVLINASAVGYYGDCGEDAVYEEGPRGSGFLAELCEAWEAATEPAAAAGIRVVKLRFGVVLTPEGGALAKMLVPFKLGLGGRFGSGEQRMPWIALADAVGAARFLMQIGVSGPVNAVAPESVTNAQFCDALARVLGRGTFLPVPRFALRAALGGQMADEMLLSGANARPRRLEIAGYRFEYPRIDDALEGMLGRS